ncbi:MAG TPA: dihydrofolate reductase family protein [Burkholderiales bacterium]
MRKMVAATFVSLDGVMQAPGGPEEDPTGGFALGGWTFPYFDDTMGQRLGEVFSVPFELLLGRKTYEIFAAHWPYVPEDDPIGKVFNATRKYVVTSSREPLAWQNSTAIRGDAAAELARLKQQDGPMLLLQGSSELIQTLLSRGLIDEFRLMIFPLVLGRGKRLFGTGAVPMALRLIDAKMSTTGVAMHTYVPAGEVRTGSFAAEQPSAAEIARRKRMAAEG